MIIRVLILLLSFIYSSFSLAKNHAPHLKELKKYYPYGLLTDDFGILNKKDLKLNTRLAYPVSFSEENPNTAYPYWQCFETKKFKMLCEVSNSPYDDYGIEMSILVISGISNGKQQEFMSRHPMSLKLCRSSQKEWKKLIKGQKHICISGSHLIKEKFNGIIIWNWILGRYKTKKGCDAFNDVCGI